MKVTFNFDDLNYEGIRVDGVILEMDMPILPAAGDAIEMKGKLPKELKKMVDAMDGGGDWFYIDFYCHEIDIQKGEFCTTAFINLQHDVSNKYNHKRGQEYGYEDDDEDD